MSSSRPIVRVAVIGAGAAGIAQAKEVVNAFAHPDAGDRDLELVVFEARNAVGGVWIEDRHPAPQLIRKDDKGKLFALPSEPGVTPSPIYPGLRTNLPKQLMSYRGHTFPEDIPLFPYASQVCDYLQDSARRWDVERYIRYRNIVRRVRKAQGAQQWTIESEDLESGRVREELFDFVSVANGHYEKTNIPEIPGLADFSGQIIHSRWYRDPAEHTGKHVLVVGAFASGSDIARELALLNLPAGAASLPTPAPSRSPSPSKTWPTRTHVYQSSSGMPSMFSSEATDPWRKFVEPYGLIERIDAGPSDSSPSVIVFKDGRTLTGIDVIIFATGYEYYYPFFKAEDEPWSDASVRLLDDTVEPHQAVPLAKGSDAKETNGLRGLGMRHVDELLMFLEKDRSMALLGLVYLVVPFPLFEIQSHLAALLWAGRLPDFPAHPSRPVHPRDMPSDSTPTAPPSDDSSAPDPARAPVAPQKRYTEQIRGALVFGFPYELDYCNFLLSLTAGADGGEASGWGKVEQFRWDFRRDTGLRKRTLGY